MQLKNLLLSIRPWFFTLFILGVLITGVYFLFPVEEGNMIDPTNALSITIIAFIFGLLLKINYTHILFIFTVFLGIILVSLLTFTQGLIAILILLFALKFFKII